jgi:hypothetical protein
MLGFKTSIKLEITIRLSDRAWSFPANRSNELYGCVLPQEEEGSHLLITWTEDYFIRGAIVTSEGGNGALCAEAAAAGTW